MTQSDKSWFDQQTRIDNLLQTLNEQSEEQNRLLTDIGNVVISMASSLGAQIQPLTSRTQPKPNGKIIYDPITKEKFRARNISSFTYVYNILPNTPLFTVKTGFPMVVPFDLAVISFSILPISNVFYTIGVIDYDKNYFATISLFKNNVSKAVDNVLDIHEISRLKSAYLTKNTIDLRLQPIIFRANQDRLYITEENLDPADTISGIATVEYIILDKF